MTLTEQESAACDSEPTDDAGSLAHNAPATSEVALQLTTESPAMEEPTENPIEPLEPTEDPELTEPVPQPEKKTGFHAMGLSDQLLASVVESGYTTPTPIQSKAIPLLLEGRDVLGQAQTGTGKTAAFALPLLDRIDTSQKCPQVLVLTPTRELAIQVAESFSKYSSNLRGFRVVPIYGGQEYGGQLKALKRGPQVIVGTPGRVMDHMRRGTLKLGGLQCLVLDEADEMLRMGFADDVEFVLTQVPKKRQMALFSATMPRPIREIAQRHLNDPSEITIAQKTATADTVNQRYIVAAPHQKQAALVRILEGEATDGILIFVKTRSTTEPLAEHLSKAGWKSAALNGDVPQKRREHIVESLRSGKIDVIVATDVAARGLDVQRISHVINYDLPFDSEAYIHRIGRTGRAGRSGEAILFVHPREQRGLKKLEYATRDTIAPMELPTNRSINKQRVARFHSKITAALSSNKLETYQSIIEHYQRENDVPMEAVAAALALMANGETPLLLADELRLQGFSGGSSGKRGKYGRDTNGRGRDSRGRSSGPPRRGARGPRGTEQGMQTYRIEVGKRNQVRPGNIVGAIANEAGIGSESIGKIKIFERHSTVDLPTSLGNAVLAKLRNVYVSGRKLDISAERS